MMRPDTTYQIQFKPRAIDDLEGMMARDRERALRRIEALSNNLSGDVKRLTNFSPDYRLRVGNYRVLFDVEDATVTIYRVVHRRDAY